MVLVPGLNIREGREQGGGMVVQCHQGETAIKTPRVSLNMACRCQEGSMAGRWSSAVMEKLENKKDKLER